jgi:predicted TIM-barrel fold metal-dependent hydrolase
MVAENRYLLPYSPVKYKKALDEAAPGHVQQSTTPALMLGQAFFGTDHLLFGTDFPFAGHYGDRVTRQTIAAIEEMDISGAEKRQIFEDNARKVMRLPV